MSMSDGISRDDKSEMLALVAEGVSYTLGSFDSTDFNAATNYLASLRLKPMDTLMREIENVKNPLVQKMLVDRAFEVARMKDSEDMPSSSDVLKWMQTYDGSIYIFWLRIKKVQGSAGAGLTLEKAKAVVDKAFAGEQAAKEVVMTAVPEKVG